MPGQTGGPAAPGGGGGGLGGVFDISQMATQAGQAGLGHLITGLFANSVDRRQYRNAEKLQNLQIVGQKHMMDYSYDKQLQMWKDTNYQAQVEQMKLAGINPGLLYGMSGGGGTTTGSGGGPTPSGQQAYHPGHDATAMAQTMMGLALQRAQKENIEADTAKKKVEAEKTAGVDTKLGETQIASITQGIENQKAVERLTNVETELKQLDTKYSRDTLEERIGQTETLYHQGLVQLQMLKRQNKLDETQFNDKVQLLKNQVGLAAAETALKDAQTRTEELGPLEAITRVQSMIAQRLQGWQALGVQERNLQMNIDESTWRQMPDPLRDVLGNLGIFVSPIGKGGTHKPVTGFRQN